MERLNLARGMFVAAMLLGIVGATWMLFDPCGRGYALVGLGLIFQLGAILQALVVITPYLIRLVTSPHKKEDRVRLRLPEMPKPIEFAEAFKDPKLARTLYQRALSAWQYTGRN